ncbi:hypothetical protein JMUB5695_00793 [Mycobacterium heckeshornense]|nr:hypothetical protein JMUB5695_00793 [Mycobacterium heckeshornense]
MVRAPSTPVQITCGSAPMAILGATEPRSLGVVPPGSTGVELGKRYHDRVSGLEVLCIQAGAGPIAADGRPLHVLHF